MGFACITEFCVLNNMASPSLCKRDLDAIPSSADFAAVLSNEPRWFVLGNQLGLSYIDLQIIAHNNVENDIYKKYTDVYSELKKQNKLKTCTWREIVEALKRMKNFELAGAISGEPLPQYPTSRSPPTQTNKYTIAQIYALVKKIRSWKSERKETIKRLKEIAGDPELLLGRAAAGFLKTAEIPFLNYAVDYVKHGTVEVYKEKCEEVCRLEMPAYKEMMEAFKAFHVKRMFGLSEIDEIEFPVSFASLQSPIPKYIRDEIEKLTQEDNKVTRAFKEIEDCK